MLGAIRLRVGALSDKLIRPERLQIMLSPEEISALDDWRFAHRLPSRAAAIRELLRRGLGVDGSDMNTTGKHSATFSVLNGTSTAKKGGKGRGVTDGA